MLATHCDKCGKVLLLENDRDLYKQMNEAGWCKLHTYGTTYESNMDLCKECYDELQAAVRKEAE